MEQNNSACYFCGSLKNQIDLETHTNSGVMYTLHECLDCKAQHWTPFKNPGAEWYERDSRYASSNIDPDLLPNWHQKKTVDFLNLRGAKILDVGCGTATFIHWAQKFDNDVFGIDFSHDAIPTAKNVFKLKNVYNMDLTTFRSSFPDIKFNLTSFFDVFEHIDNHKEFLNEIKSSLVLGGHIAMSMPYRLGARWLMGDDFPPRHLTRWDRKSLTRYLNQEGFEVLYIRRLSEGVGYLVTKLRRKYGKYFSLGLIGKMKKKARKDGKIDLESKEEKEISRVHKLARLKDWVVFGLPALVIYIAMLLTPKRYITLFVIAKKKDA